MKVFEKERVSRKELRHFGMGLALLSVLISGLLFWKGRSGSVHVLLVGWLLAMAFWFDAPWIRFVYSGWMKLAEGMSRIMTRILLSLLYLLVLTPIGFLGRICGQPFVVREFRGRSDSYWTPHKGSGDPRDSEKQS